MPSRHKGKRVVVYFGEDLDQAMTARLKVTGETPSNLIREALAHFLGQPDAAAVPMGRPRKTAADTQEPESPAPRKTARANSGKKVTAPKKSSRKGLG